MLTAILPAILILVSENGISQVEGSRILRLRAKGRITLVTTTLDDALLHNPISTAVYFTNAKLRDKRDGLDTISDLLTPLTNYPRILEVYLINCERPANKNDCLAYGYGEPGLRFFHNEFDRKQHLIHHLDSFKGLEVHNESYAEMRNLIFDALMDVKLKAPGSPNFNPILSTDTAASLFKQANCKCITNIVLADQSEEGSLVGRDTVLALLKREKTLVRIVDNPTYFENFGLQFLRREIKLAIIPRSRKAVKLHPKYPTGKSFALTVNKYLDDIF